MSEAEVVEAPEAVELPPPSGRWARLGRAAAWTYVPQLAALVLSPVTECSHCVATFWALFAFLPGFVSLAILRLPSVFPWIAAVAITLAVIWAHDALRHRTRSMLVARLVLAALTALNAIAFGNVIRM